MSNKRDDSLPLPGMPLEAQDSDAIINGNSQMPSTNGDASEKRANTNNDQVEALTPLQAYKRLNPLLLKIAKYNNADAIEYEEILDLIYTYDQAISLVRLANLKPDKVIQLMKDQLYYIEQAYNVSEGNVEDQKVHGKQLARNANFLAMFIRSYTGNYPEAIKYIEKAIDFEPNPETQEGYYKRLKEFEKENAILQLRSVQEKIRKKVQDQTKDIGK